jgi:hypothetical protein
MLGKVGLFACKPVRFDRTGGLVDPTEPGALKQAITPDVTDLLVMSHGWNNTMSEADELYQGLLTSMSSLIANGPHVKFQPRKLLVCTLYWPSKRFADSTDISGGAAGIEDPDASIAAKLDGIRQLFDGSDVNLPGAVDPDVVQVIDHLKQIAPRLEVDGAAQEEFARLLRSIFPRSANQEEPALPESFFTLDGTELLNRLARRAIDPAPPTGGAAALDPQVARGGAASIGNVFAGIKNGAFNLLNLFTYYEMKERAGVIGGQGVHALLLDVQKANPNVRLHLAGHSFGGRLVTAALASEDGGTLTVASISLLQAAFSHFGLSQRYDGTKDGFFRNALQSTRLLGPMAVTYSTKDRAVGIAYPLASRLRQQIAASLGDANDPYGGIGRNGALKTPEANTVVYSMPDTMAAYQGLNAAKILNVEASGYVSSHSDVKGPQVAHMVLSAMEATLP